MTATARRRLIVALLITATALAVASRIDTYRSHYTGNPVVIVNLHNSEAGYADGWFHCQKGEC